MNCPPPLSPQSRGEGGKFKAIPHEMGEDVMSVLPRYAALVSVFLPFLVLPLNESQPEMEPKAKSPEASLKCIKTRPGFTVELVAAEPLVMDPIAFAWGP